jgi:transposase
MPSGNRSFGTEISGNREFNHEFTSEQRAAIMAELHAGKSQREVADNFSTTQGTISKTKRRWEQYHNLASQPRKGRPKKLTPLQLIRINSYINRHREITWNDVLYELELDVSIRTLKRRLQSNWRRKWRSKRRIELSEEGAKARLEHCTFWLRHLDDYICVSRFKMKLFPLTLAYRFASVMRLLYRMPRITLTAGSFAGLMRNTVRT